MNSVRIMVLGLAMGAATASCSDEPRGVPAGTGNRPVMAFEEADLDKSGALSTQEAVLVPGLDLLAADRDRDGIVSREEYQAWATGGRGTVAGTADASGPKP